MAKPRRIEVIRVRKDWMLVEAGKITHERVLPGSSRLIDLHPEFVRRIGRSIVFSIDDPTGAWLQIEISDAGIFDGVNRSAIEYASKHGGEISGKFWPDIPETTRTKIREIIKNAFENKTPVSRVAQQIQDADIFSEARAKMIADTEISNAQVRSSLDLYKKVGAKIKWTANGPDPCPACLMNDGEIRKVGEAFPSGDLWPVAHPNCYCDLIPVLDK